MHRIGKLLGCCALLLVSACETGEGVVYNGPLVPDATEEESPDATPVDQPDAYTGACEQTTPVEFRRVPAPDLLLVVDKSGSMKNALANGQAKWGVMKTALKTVVSAQETGIDFGLMLYPTGAQCQSGAVVVHTAGDNRSSIESELDKVTPEGGTPTHTTLTGALDYFRGRPPKTSGQFVLLATDGQPNCKLNQGFDDSSIEESVDAIQALAAAGIKTFVLGFGSAVNNDPQTLQAMAVAGGTAEYYPANTPAELASALKAIAGYVTIPPCSYALEIEPPYPSLLRIKFDGQNVLRDPNMTQGWQYDVATNNVVFYGASCQKIQEGQVEKIDVDYGCAGPVID